jgi:hypothetical protein
MIENSMELLFKAHSLLTRQWCQLRIDPGFGDRAHENLPLMVGIPSVAGIASPAAGTWVFGIGSSPTSVCVRPLRFRKNGNCDIRVFMPKQETVISKKRRGPTPTGKGVPIMVRIQPDMLAGIDQFVAEHQVSRPEAVRLIIRDWLKRHQVLRAEWNRAQPFD